MSNKIVVLLKTHKWNPDIEKFAMKIKNETIPFGIDFYILMHTDDGKIFGQINDNGLKNLTLKFTENEIKNVYQAGYYGIWLSNHWILMWFYKQFGTKYSYFWSIEYDVRIVGNSTTIWNHNSSDDFLYTLGNYRNPNHVYNSSYVGGRLSDSQKYYGYLQLARYSNKALGYLNKCFEEGENGQDEMITFSLLRRGQFTISREFLKKLIRGVWSWQTKHIERNKIIYQRALELEKQYPIVLCIFHPIK